MIFNPAGILVTVTTTDDTVGGNDIIYGEAGDDVLIGGTGDDRIDGGAGKDLIFGDNVLLDRTATLYNYTNPRFRVLTGTQIYSTDPATAGQVNVSSTGVWGVDPRGAANWADFRITMLDTSGAAGTYGNDYIAGGAGDDEIFGQLGNDTIQGDGSIDLTVGAYVDATHALVVQPSVDDYAGAGTDGNDYIEGGGGADVIFGNQGQDDIIGGNSSLFSLSTPAVRPDSSDLIFGGSGTEIGRNDLGDTSANGHSHDADMIIGDDGNIYRLVGVNGVIGGTAPGIAYSAGFLSYNYDNYPNETEKIIARAAQLIDYTPGTGSSTDNGAADYIHGEAGNDEIYGEVGNDVLYGDGQDDTIVGGAGNDWISGGTGDDGILGDDGRIMTSRNSASFGEPLYGIAALSQSALSSAISTPGKAQTATINVAGQLKRTVDEEPYGFGGDDIIYGGWGNDSIHGGAGDDAISGAEAPVYGLIYATYVNNSGGSSYVTYESDYSHPFVLSGNNTQGYTNLGYNYDGSRRFVAYDYANPMAQIPNFFLNFDATENSGNDGNDVLFGDTGNDWIVGGTGSDDMYGGEGDDLLNADDNITTSTQDTDTFKDIAYGGAGLDVLIANTSNDRLIDWVGEFNSYIVPFSPFGNPTVSRTNEPALRDFLYALSASDGADPTRTTAYGPAGEATAGVTYDGIGYGDPARNGEPYGEIGAVIQSDPAWQDQTGAPRDPQPGNTPGVQRITTFQTNFNGGGATTGMLPDQGTWTVGGGSYSASATTGDNVSLIYSDQWLPSYLELSSTFKVRTGGAGQNAFFIFNYLGPTNFDYAGVDAQADLLRIGQRTTSGWIDLATAPASIKTNTTMSVLVVLSGYTATLTVGKFAPLSYTFSTPLNIGMLALGTQSSLADFGTALVQKLPISFTFTYQPSFSGPTLPAFTTRTGTWTLANNLDTGVPDASGSAITTRALAVAPATYLEYSATVSTQATGGLIFDYFSPTDFKYVAIVAGKNQVVIGHRNSSGYVVDASGTATITAGTAYTLLLAIQGSTSSVANTVNVVLNGASVTSFTDNDLLNAGGLGFLAQGGSASFGAMQIRGDDPQYANGGFNEDAASLPSAPATAIQPLTPQELAPIVAAAIDRWVSTGSVDAKAEAELRAAQFQIVTLTGTTLGTEIGGTTVQIDATADGFGWFVDTTPYDDSEFDGRSSDGSLAAIPPSPAAGHMDLLTVVMHELGHVLGFDDVDTAGHPNNLMDDTLDPGVRRLPTGSLVLTTPSAGVSSPSPGLPRNTVPQNSPAGANTLGDTVAGAKVLPPKATTDPVATPGATNQPTRVAEPGLGTLNKTVERHHHRQHRGQPLITRKPHRKPVRAHSGVPRPASRSS
jgi:Ca2+-binding RTX toxin-like protein